MTRRRRQNPARAGRQEYRSREVRELRDGEPYYTVKNEWLTHPPTLTEGHFDLDVVREATAIASQAKRDGVPLGRGHFGETFRVTTSRGPVVVKLAAATMLYSERRAWTRAEQRQNLMHEAGVANELSDMGFSIIPESVYVELDDGTPAIVREYGEVANLSPQDFYDVERQLLDLEERTRWRVQDDLLVLRRPDGSLFIGDVGIWQPPTIRQGAAGKTDHATLEALLENLAQATFGAPVTPLPRIEALIDRLQTIDDDDDGWLADQYRESLKDGLASRARFGIPSPQAQP
jgi:hypothetical protein